MTTIGALSEPRLGRARASNGAPSRGSTAANTKAVGATAKSTRRKSRRMENKRAARGKSGQRVGANNLESRESLKTWQGWRLPPCRRDYDVRHATAWRRAPPCRG